MADDELEVVPLTDQDKADLAEAWELHRQSLANPEDIRGIVSSGNVMTRVLAAHGFEPYVSAMEWGEGRDLVVRARRRK